MSVFDSAGNESTGTTDEGTDPRDRNAFYGIDSRGDHHIYKTHVEAIVVVNPEEGKIVHREDKHENARHVGIGNWCEAIEEAYGWEDCRHAQYGETFMDSLEDLFERHDAASEEDA